VAFTAATDRMGYTARHHACQNGHTKIAGMLVASGAQGRPTGRGLRPISSFSRPPVDLARAAERYENGSDFASEAEGHARDSMGRVTWGTRRPSSPSASEAAVPIGRGAADAARASSRRPGSAPAKR
jgi:ankyrin repeat protein